jgi:hypothetical protein
MVMRKLRTLLLAGVAATAIAGFAGLATAASLQTHVMTIALPGGGIAQIRYTGNTAPQVVLQPAPGFAAWPSVFAPDPAFAALDRISAEMDRAAASLLRQAQMLATQAPAGVTETALANMPAGSRSYSFVSTMNGNGVCMRSTEITSRGDGRPPQVVTHSSGNCGPLAGGMGSAALPTAPTPTPGPEILQTGAVGPHPYAGLIREATWQ